MCSQVNVFQSIVTPLQIDARFVYELLTHNSLLNNGVNLFVSTRINANDLQY